MVRPAGVTGIRNGKIFVISLPLRIGGTENHLLSVLPALKDRGLDITLVTLGTAGPLGEAVAAKDVSVVSRRRSRLLSGLAAAVPVLDSIDLFFWLFWLFIRHRPAAAHFFLPKPYLIGGTAALAAFVPIRIMSRRSLNDYQSKHRLASILERRLHRRMSAVLGNSRAVVRQLLGEGVSARRVGLLYNGVRLPRPADVRTRAEQRSKFDIADDELVVVQTASFYPYKRHDVALQAASLLEGRNAGRWRLIFAGRDAGEMEAAIRLAARLGIERRVLFAGEAKNVDELLLCADVGLLCSDQEGFSNAILEYMAHGLPVVATDTGGNGEAVINGESGLIVPAGNPEAVADALSSLLGDKKHRLAMGRAARRRVGEHFHETTMVDRYLKLYTVLLTDPEPDLAGVLDAGPSL